MTSFGPGEVLVKNTFLDVRDNGDAVRENGDAPHPFMSDPLDDPACPDLAWLLGLKNQVFQFKLLCKVGRVCAVLIDSGTSQA